jgi:hypothetical protein
MTFILKKDTPKEELDKFLAHKSSPAKKHNFEKYVGKIKFQGDPLLIQKKMRDEWQ